MGARLSSLDQISRSAAQCLLRPLPRLRLRLVDRRCFASLIVVIGYMRPGGNLREFLADNKSRNNNYRESMVV